MEIERTWALADFNAARAKAFRRAIRSILTRRATRLHSIAASLQAAGFEGKSYGGVEDIPLDKIAGSVAPESKTVDFDANFLPLNPRLRDRWVNVYAAMVATDVPPIDVYRVDDKYYVIDGHRRVSVARALERPTIRARVINVRTRAPLPSEADTHTLLRAAEYSAFLQETQLHRTRPQARLECSRLGRYDEIMQHILGHRYFMSLEQGRDVPLQEAAASWYDHVYHPIAEAIRRHKVLEQLPGWTEADLYVEITRRWLALSEEGEPSGPDPAIKDLLAEHAKTWWRRRRKIRLPA
ncbi:MAG TPA: DUF4032 domain-containing protein [Candidatus Acidoferrum sp.]|nr:DUF4032 domain-containing protein [Candidatus Acidoferrum sp.]